MNHSWVMMSNIPYGLICPECYMVKKTILLRYQGTANIMVEITGNVTGYQSIEHFIWKCSRCNFRKNIEKPRLADGSA